MEDALGLYVVCDGASGGPAGEVAARVAVAALEDFAEQTEREHGSWSAERVERGLHHAMAAVLEAGRTDARLEGMSTTVTMLLAQGRRGVVGHTGDSRAHLIRRGRGQVLTVDHDLTSELASVRDGAVPIDVFELDLLPGDTVVLCTDGAEEVVLDPAIVRAAGGLSPALLASRIVSAAHRRNPGQDATVVVVRVHRENEPGWLELSTPDAGRRVRVRPRG